MEGVVEHGLVPKRLSVSDLMNISYENLRMSHRLTVGDFTHCQKINTKKERKGYIKMI